MAKEDSASSIEVIVSCKKCGKSPLSPKNKSGYCKKHKSYGAAQMKAGRDRYHRWKKQTPHAELIVLLRNILTRVDNPNHHTYKYYGGRGIKCYWQRGDEERFVQWILENLGERPEDMSLDRIDVDGDYAPGNLRWADAKTQAINKRSEKSIFLMENLNAALKNLLHGELVYASSGEAEEAKEAIARLGVSCNLKIR